MIHSTAVYIELEVPVGKRFSIAGEWIFPDWVDRETNRYCLQTNIKSLEFRMWLGNRNVRRVLTGHYVGVYGQTGDFDFQPFTEQGFRCYVLPTKLKASIVWTIPFARKVR